MGKTKLLEKIFPGEIEVISADSIQVYRGMDIGTAKPTGVELQKIPHHLIDIRDPDQTFSTGDFFLEAESALQSIDKKYKIPVMCGGTAFYFKHFLFGLPQAPPADQEVRQQVEKLFQEWGPQKFQSELCLVDPTSAARISPRDYYRQKRAYEVFLSSGKPLSSFSSQGPLRTDRKILLIGLQREKNDLHSRQIQRIADMVNHGLIQEIKNLLAAGYNEFSPGLKGIGYAEFLPWIIRREGTLEEAQEKVILHTRQYAKRQMTFFRTFPLVDWYHPEDEGAILDRIQTYFSSPK